MEIIAIGLNHKTAPVELRERLVFSETKLVEAYSVLRNFPSIQESLILSTCNRVEIYGVVDNIENGISDLKQFLSTYHHISLENFEHNLYIYLKSDSVDHLFNVACGLDSMVIGETQILGQLKRAYFKASQNNSVGKTLNVLLQKAFRTTKEVRNSTNITKGSASVSSVAVKLIEKVLSDFSQREIMIVGAGKNSELAVKYLISKGVSSILVSNRTYKKAQEMAERFQGEAIRFDQLLAALVKIDILISSTSAPHFVIRKKEISDLMKQRKGRPLFLVDLAVPRDIEPEVGEIESVYLYDIDDIQKVVDKNIQLRQIETEASVQIIQRRVTEFMDWLERHWLKAPRFVKDFDSGRIKGTLDMVFPVRNLTKQNSEIDVFKGVNQEEVLLSSR